MTRDEILQEFKNAGAMLTGHFILSSGLHSTTYLQCARVLMDAARGERLCSALAAKLREELTSADKIDLVVAPAMGGVVVGYEMGRQLGVNAIFCERVDSMFAFRRGFSVEPGARVLIVEDVVTTGKSSIEALECIRHHGADAVAIASLVDRRGKNDAELPLPLIALLKLDIPTYTLDALPASLQDIPPVKPGSRWLKG